MGECHYYWVEFAGYRLRAENKAEAVALVLKRFEDGSYPEFFVEQDPSEPFRKLFSDEK